LEDDDNELQGVDVDKAGSPGPESADAVEDRGTPGHVEPEAEAGTVGTATKEAGIAPGPKVWVTGDNQTEGDLPRGIGGLDIGEKVAQGLQHGVVDGETLPSRPKELRLVPGKQGSQAVEEGGG
jgi:hypothetical protein